MSEEVYLREGEPVFVSNDFDSMFFLEGALRKFHHIEDEFIVATLTDQLVKWGFCVPLSKYDSENVSATRQEVLHVKDGKLVKFYNDQTQC